MELLLAVLLAASLVSLAATWSALRTERSRGHRLRDLLASVRAEAAKGGAAFRDEEPVVPRIATSDAPPPAVEPPHPAPVPFAEVAPAERLAATLVSPAERLAESLERAEPALAAAAERLRSPLPAPAAAPDVADAPSPSFRVEGVSSASATAERITDERARLADDVRSLRSALERVSTLDGELGRGLSELSRSADALLPLASSVSGLADRANLLGLNVSLLAARAGEAGAPFEEAAAELRGLFEEARRLSRDLSDAARRTASGVRGVSTLVQESAGAVAAGQERGARATERLGALDGLCSQLERTLSDAARSTLAAADEGAVLAARLESARGSLKARAVEAERLRAETEASRAALRAVTERIEALRLDGGALRAAVARVTSAA